MRDEPPEPDGWQREISLVAAGDEPAAVRMVDALYPHVIRIVRSHLPRCDDEEDLAQEIFMKVFSKLRQFDGRQPFEHWVARVALNTCYDRLRRQKARPQLSYADLSLDEGEFLEHALTTATATPDADTCGDLALELLEKLIATLKPREQVVIRLLDLEERSVQEACELTGWGASKVKVTAMRARRHLCEALERLEPGLRNPSHACA
jgi:RNA polymerase sigma-70 factor (ECF subfamily)